jgi:D-arabinose 1-dehydrogenase-like Zn-dependent alcohol dehydrogenase
VIHGQFDSKLPMIPSHEPAGKIVQVGAKCRGRWQVGDRVGVLNFKKACSECTGCRLSKREYGTLDPRFCETREMAGFKHDGAFAEYMVADPETTVKLPPSLSFEQAAPLMCAGVSRHTHLLFFFVRNYHLTIILKATVWGALEKATSGLKGGETIAIIGIGGLGHLGVQFSKALGYRTIAVDSRSEGRQLASEVSNLDLVPDLVIDSTSPDASAKIFEYTEGEGIAAAVVCTDSLAANEWALTLLRIGGTLILLGLPPEKWRFDAGLIVFRELVLRGSYVASRESTERMVAVVERSRVASHLTVIPFADVPRVADAYQDKAFRGRLVVQIAEE